MRKPKKKTLIGIGVLTSLITSGWVVWQHLKARKMQADIDTIPYDLHEKDRRAGWCTKYRGQ